MNSLFGIEGFLSNGMLDTSSNRPVLSTYLAITQPTATHTKKNPELSFGVSDMGKAKTFLLKNQNQRQEMIILMSSPIPRAGAFTGNLRLAQKNEWKVEAMLEGANGSLQTLKTLHRHGLDTLQVVQELYRLPADQTIHFRVTPMVDVEPGQYTIPIFGWCPGIGECADVVLLNVSIVPGGTRKKWLAEPPLDTYGWNAPTQTQLMEMRAALVQAEMQHAIQLQQEHEAD